MADEPALSGGDKTILVVEDEVLIRHDISEHLRSHGFNVVEANSATEAIKVLQDSIEISVVFTDVRMPGTANGIPMKKLFVICTVPLLLSATSAFAAMSKADCEAMFKKADTNSDGSLDSTEAKVYMDAMTKASITPLDPKKLSNMDFMKACQAGAFDSLKT
jgi:two-component system, response regulator PdtaR